MISIDDLLKAAKLGLRLRVAGDAPQTWLRDVRIVHTSEEISQLRGDELVLVDARSLDQLPDDHGMVASLNRRYAAALGYAPVSPRKMPSQLVTACKRSCLPLVEIPPGVSCEQVAEVAFRLIHGRRSSGMSGLVRREQALARRLINRGGVHAILQLLSKELGVRMWLLTRGAAVSAGRPAPRTEDIEAVLAATQQQRGAFEITLSSDTPAWVYPLQVAQRAGRRTAFCVCELPSQGASVELELALDQAVSFVEAALAMRYAMREERRPAEDEFIGRIEGGQATPEEGDAWSRALGFQPRGHLTCVLVRGQHVTGPMATEIEHALRDLADSLGVAHVVVKAQGEVRAFLLQPDGVEPELDEALVRTRGVLDRQSGRGDATWGSSSVLAEQVSDFTRVLHDARQVCILNSLREGAPSSSDSADVSLGARLLAQDEQASAALRDAILAPLVEYDNSHTSDLVHTLDVFLSTCGQWSTSASRLNVHVNTLRYRLGRVEHITGRSLSSMSDRVDLFLAIRTRTIRDAETSG